MTEDTHSLTCRVHGDPGGPAAGGRGRPQVVTWLSCGYCHLHTAGERAGAASSDNHRQQAGQEVGEQGQEGDEVRHITKSV